MAKTQIRNYVFKPGLGALDNLYPNAYSLLESNKEFIQKEATAWIQTQVDAGAPGFAGYTYNQPKCERDVGYVIDAYLYDLKYGGNFKLRNTIKYYWEQDVAQVDGDRTPEIETHTFIGDLITDYIFTNTAYSADNIYVTQTIDSSKTVETGTYTPTGATYNPSTGIMTLTIPDHDLTEGDIFVIEQEALTFTCNLDNNATEHNYPRASGVPNTTGRDPFYNTALRIDEVNGDVITVFVGISSDTSVHTFVRASSNCIVTSAARIIDSMVFATTEVIDNGLDYMPTSVDAGIGYVKIQGRYNADELLLISNATRSEVMYNFTNVNTGATVSIQDSGADEDFPTYLQTTDAVTRIELNYDTRTHSATDEIQIFVERIENGKSVVTTRPFDFGTDAIERNRAANPLSMLDADFEYGLQPTKWAAIGTLRGYPSVYEVPGTDTPVLSVVTDASAGTDGVGQSLITVTTVGPHGFEPGDPITIKALEDAVVGAARAEGSFVITTVPSDTTFTYFAKSKVGTTNGDVLSTGYTQLREAGFYTGANIGGPTWTIASNGSAGTMTSQLAVLSGSTVIPFDDQSPEIGSPLVAADGSIPLGSQVTGIVDQSQGGGTYLSPLTVNDVSAGTNQLEFQDISGVVENLAVDRGDGFGIHITNITGNVVTFNGNFTEPVIGNRTNYTDVTGINDSSVGENAKFDISYAVDSSFTYVVDAIQNDGGENYKVGDRIIIPGDKLGGTSPANDALIIVTGILDSASSIASVDIFGTHFNNDIYLPNQTATFTGGNGTEAEFDISFLNNAFTSVTVGANAGTGYKVGDLLEIEGFIFSQNANPLNFLRISVDAVDVNGAITSVTFDGTAPNAYIEFPNPSYTSTTATGANAAFDVVVNGTNYEVTITNAGVNYLATETFTILGSALGGTDVTNDLTIVIDNVGASGEITAVTATGATYNGETSLGRPANIVTPDGAAFNVSQNDAVYVVELAAEGENYNVGQELVIPGTAFGAETPENDVTITVTGIDDITSGAITAISSSGTGYEPIGIYLDVSGDVEQPTGTAGRISLTRENGLYGSITVANAGANYAVGNRIIIRGNQLGGQTPINDLTIQVDSVDVSGGINTFTAIYEEAAFGDRIDLISTVTMSEATTADMDVNTAITYGALATLEIEFPTAHGLVPGDTFIVNVGSDDGVNNHALAAGSFFASDIPSVTQLRYQARAEGSINVSTDDISGEVYPRPDSFFIHRPYDGGVQLGTGGPQHGAQAIRQSKKYIRYQSGKGIMYTTGALFAPSYDLRSLTAEDVEVGSLITVVTDDNDHGVQVGGVVRILGVETPGYNSGNETATPPKFDYDVVEVVDERTFKIRAQRRLGATEAVLGFGAQMSVVSWHGATVRSGIFDDQNGIFWEYDGTQISVVQRTGTRQLAGTIQMSVDSNLVSGTNARFQDQLKAGDRIIIKGMTHVVSHVNSQTECTVTPDWRGVTDIAGTKANLIVDKKVKQRDFNLDTLDGTGPSGYDIDIAKMQMIGIQYSWYGAGFIDFMLRGQDGNFIFAHRMRNSNVNTEAFMRSGNLPVRYEVTNEGPSGKLKETLPSGQNYMVLEDTSFFPTSGTVYIDNEIIDFNGKDDSLNRLTGLTRGATFENFQAGATRQYSAGVDAQHQARTGVILISQTITPLISHWGSAFITDGGFDEDRGYIFSYTASGIDVSTNTATAFLIRLAPSVSNALTGDLGERELLNRAQLLLQGLEITSDGVDGSNNPITGSIVVEGILNPQNYPVNPALVSWSGLGSKAQGGQPSFAQIAPGGAIDWGATSATATATISSDIDSGYVYIPSFGNRENSSPIEVTQASYQTNGDVLVGSVIYGGNGSTNDVYTGGGEGTYYVEQIRRDGNVYDVSFRSTTGETRRANDWPSGSTLVRFVYETYTGRTSRLMFTKASWEASGATIGTPVSTTDTNWPAGTAVSNVQLRSHANQEFYEVTFNQTSTTNLSAGNTVTFEFGAAAAAEPGETVFSFIANPGERSTTSFAELKELTNTPLGGRGTYPNGPDVLAINVYKVAGADTKANIILKWGEAQA